jgi:hypothetical protein
MPSSPQEPSSQEAPRGWLVLRDVKTNGLHIVDIYLYAVHVPTGRMREVRLSPRRERLDGSWFWGPHRSLPHPGRERMGSPTLQIQSCIGCLACELSKP